MPYTASPHPRGSSAGAAAGAAIRYDVAQCARIAALYPDLVRAG